MSLLKLTLLFFTLSFPTLKGKSIRSTRSIHLTILPSPRACFCIWVPLLVSTESGCGCQSGFRTYNQRFRPAELVCTRPPLIWLTSHWLSLTHLYPLASSLTLTSFVVTIARWCFGCLVSTFYTSHHTSIITFTSSHSSFISHRSSLITHHSLP